MERRSFATVVCFVYAAFCVAILGHALFGGRVSDLRCTLDAGVTS
jgi:hypothetical protein